MKATVHVGFFGNGGFNGAQAEALRVPWADGTLHPLDVGVPHYPAVPLSFFKNVTVGGERSGSSGAQAGGWPRHRLRTI